MTRGWRGPFPAAEITLPERLARMPRIGLPLHHPVTIRWNDYAVPFIEAADDHDLAFALGLVHAHLREAQLALGKRLAYGRLSECLGPFGWKLDATLRILGFADAAAIAEQHLPAASRAWLQHFADGLNWYQDHAPPPPESRLLGLRREAWMLRDLLAIGRLAGTDINWGTLFELLKLRDRQDWPEIWHRTLDAAGIGTSFEADRQGEILSDLLRGVTRPGSNSIVVSARRSKSGGALLASDPHLSLFLPNLWIAAGVRAPSLHAVGLMPAGLPIFGLGRNAHLAWGGTNMRAAASDLYDVTAAPDPAIVARSERLRTRFWRGRRITVRRSRFGAIISDAPMIRTRPGETVALRWMGNEPSDEIGAFLAAARARTPEEFRAAFASYGVGGQNMQFAHRNGQIGQIMAAWLPRRGRMRPDAPVLDPRDPATRWQGIVTAVDLPWICDPPEGFLASANNLPARFAIPVSYFFVTSERVERLKLLLKAQGDLSLEALRALQQDVTSPASLRLKDELVGVIEEAGLAAAQPAFLTRLRGWDGRYGAEDAGPVLFETLLYHVVARLRMPRRHWNMLVAYTVPDLRALSPPARTALLRSALAAAARDAARFACWGEMHRMRVEHVLSRIPVVGRRYRVADYPVSGSRETVMKTAHGLVRKRHRATYGSDARFLADMSDPDATFCVLLGGQDGWIGSANAADQLALWRSGRDVRLPMTETAVAREFRHVQVLQPG